MLNSEHNKERTRTMPKHYYTDEEIQELFRLNNSNPVSFARYIAELCAQSVGQTSPEACAKIQDVWQRSEALEKIYTEPNGAPEFREMNPRYRR